MDVEDNVVDFEMEGGSVFKIPVKRKKKSCGKAFKQVRKDDGSSENVSSDSDRDSSDSNMSVSSQNENLICLYRAEDIRFLQETKEMKGVKVEDFFPYCKQFINYVRYLMKEGAFQDVEVYRLRKLVNKLIF